MDESDEQKAGKSNPNASQIRENESLWKKIKMFWENGCQRRTEFTEILALFSNIPLHQFTYLGDYKCFSSAVCCFFGQISKE